MQVFSTAKVFLRYDRLNRQDVLLLRRSANDASRPGGLDIPGGEIEPGETAVDAVLRETYEETGQRLQPDDVRRIYCHTEVNYEAGKIVMREIFAGFTDSRDVKLSDEHSEGLWVPRQKVFGQPGMNLVHLSGYAVLHDADLWPYPQQY